MTLFIYLKIILLQYFQFSVLSKLISFETFMQASGPDRQDVVYWYGTTFIFPLTVVDLTLVGPSHVREGGYV